MAHPDLTDQQAAGAFRTLLDHLANRRDAQNVDLMGLAGFCRNCLSDWVAEADPSLSKEEARELVYGEPYVDWKAKHQQPASPEQLARMDESVARNAR